MNKFVKGVAVGVTIGTIALGYHLIKKNDKNYDNGELNIIGLGPVATEYVPLPTFNVTEVKKNEDGSIEFYSEIPNEYYEVNGLKVESIAKEEEIGEPLPTFNVTEVKKNEDGSIEFHSEIPSEYYENEKKLTKTF